MPPPIEPVVTVAGGIDSIADRLTATRAKADTLRFSECLVSGRKGYEWGAVMSTNPKLVRLFCDIWNEREAIAAAIRERR